MKNTLLTILSVLTGIVFIISGYTKLYPIEPFELNFVEQGFANWTFAPILSRLLIGLEFGLGVFLILNFELKKFTIKATVALLMFFTLYLLFGIIKDGNVGNCGCFGNTFAMTPLQSIYKNVGLLISCIILFLFKKDYPWKFKRLIWCSTVIAGLVTPYILNVPEFFYINNYADDKVNYELPLNLIYTKDNIEKPTLDLRKGKHLIGFFSLTCPHCRIASMKMHILSLKYPQYSFFMILNGEKELQQNFFETTKSEQMNHFLYNEDDFVKLCGPNVPIMMVIDNGFVKKKIDYAQFNEKEIISLLK